MGAKLERGSLLHKRYRIIEILGQGGMGSVYRAVDENLGMDVVVKENLFTSDEYARQFRLEAVILASLRHPNLPRVTDHFVIGDQGQYLVMDYIDGEDLRQRIERSGSISEQEGILIGAAMCDALQYLHTRKPPIIHRDLKPGNVRITPDGRICLVDFGLAKLVKGGQATTTGARAMTPGYSPPEQYGTARTDARTDIYSLGATLYAALTVVIPEDGLARAIDNLELTPLRKRNPKISRKLAAAIEKALSVHPEDRFQSAEEFKQALLNSNNQLQPLEEKIVVDPTIQTQWSKEKVDLGNEISKDPGYDPIPMPPSKPGKKGRIAIWWIIFPFLAIIILLTLISLPGLWSKITKAFPGQLIATTPLSTPTVLPMVTKLTGNSLPPSTPQMKTETPQPTNPVTRTPLPTYMPSLTPSPTATSGPTPTFLGGSYSQIAFASDRTGIPQIYLMNSEGSVANDPQQITNMTYGACQPTWSPDGARLVFISPCPKRLDQYPGAKMYMINADGSGLIPLDSEEGGDFDPAWSPDGMRIAFTSLRDGSLQIYVLDLSDKRVTRLTEASSDIHQPDWSRQPAWSPSGTQIIFSGHGRLTNALQIWVRGDTGLGQTFLIRRGDTQWDFLPDWSPDGKTILFGETSGNQQLGWLMLYDYEKQTAGAVPLRMQALGTHGDFSPDGNWIAYETKDNQNTSRLDYDIYRIKSDGTGAIIRLTNSRSVEFDPAWRPSGIP